jgi:hypothetical protein
MEIKRDELIEDFLLTEIQRNLGDGVRDGMHFSDLLSMKQAYWRSILPMKATKAEAMYWLTGNAHETLFLHLSDLKHGKSKQWNGIWYTPDVFFNFPVELKTTRRGFIPKEGNEAKIYEHYLKQLRMYCAAENTKQSWLVVWFLVMMDENRRQTKPDYFCYRVEFTDEELEATRQQMLDSSALLKAALNEKDPTHLPDCEQWMCYKEQRNMVEKPFCLTCNKEFQVEWGIKKHVESKTGKGHEVRHAKFEIIKEPRCKYSKDCKPELWKAYEDWKTNNAEPVLESEEEDVG